MVLLSSLVSLFLYFIPFIGTLSSISFPGTLGIAHVQFSRLYHLIVVNQHICIVLGRARHTSTVEVLFQWLTYTSTMCTLKTKMQRHRSGEKQVYSCKIMAGCMRLVNSAAHCNLFERKQVVKEINNVVFQKYTCEVQFYSLLKLLLCLYFNRQGFLKTLHAAWFNARCFPSGPFQ